MLHPLLRRVASRADLAKAITTAFEHTAAGGVALFQPDFVLETFESGTETGGSDAGDRALRYLEWWWAPEAKSNTYVTDMAYLPRDETGAVEVVNDRHLVGRLLHADGAAHRGAARQARR